MVSPFLDKLSRMIKPPSFLKIFTQTGPLVVLAVAIALLVGIVGPASAQFFNFGNFGGPPRPASRGGGGWFGSDFFAPFQPQAPRRVYQDFSRAPPPEKRETVPERNVMVMGDGMADWLAYGLEDTYADQPDMGVIRKARNTSGLIRYQPKGEPADWAAAARSILASEKPDVIVVMLGLNDRIPIHEPVVEKSEKDKEKEKSAEKKGDKKGKPAENKADEKAKAGNNAKTNNKTDDKADDKADDKGADAELDEADSETPPAHEKAPRSPNGIYEFRDERWVELYAKKIEEMIAVVKAKGVPVVWVGLPAIRGARGTSDMLFLDSLYREQAARAGITYVDVWDGFVDERGLYLQKGPDFEGQIRQLRSWDGVYFTKYGARKLAHYVEREIARLLAARSAPLALPTEPATPEANAVPGQPAPRPLAGPILPLVAASVSSDQLLGGPGTRPAAVDPLTARTLVKGEALSPPAGRADDYAWPRREVALEPAKDPAKQPGREPGKQPGKSDVPVANARPGERSAKPAVPGAPAAAVAPRPAPAKRPPPQASPFGNFFGFGNSPQRQAPPRQYTPRPPAPVGRSASVQ